MVTYWVIALVLPICQDVSQWTSRRDGYRPFPPQFTGSPRTDLMQTNQFFLGKRVVQSHK